MRTDQSKNTKIIIDQIDDVQSMVGVILFTAEEVNCFRYPTTVVIYIASK